jgi:hypothetical protein
MSPSLWLECHGAGEAREKGHLDSVCLPLVVYVALKSDEGQTMLKNP